jgi:hypothetical protein
MEREDTKPFYVYRTIDGIIFWTALFFAFAVIAVLGLMAIVSIYNTRMH